jgi:hypothetical protein
MSSTKSRAAFFRGFSLLCLERNESTSFRQAKFGEWELSASTGSWSIFLHPDSKVELEKCEITDDPRMSVCEGVKSETAVSN